MCRFALVEPTGDNRNTPYNSGCLPIPPTAADLSNLDETYMIVLNSDANGCTDLERARSAKNAGASGVLMIGGTEGDAADLTPRIAPLKDDLANIEKMNIPVGRISLTEGAQPLLKPHNECVALCRALSLPSLVACRRRSTEPACVAAMSKASGWGLIESVSVPAGREPQCRSGCATQICALMSLHASECTPPAPCLCMPLGFRHTGAQTCSRRPGSHQPGRTCVRRELAAKRDVARE